MIEVVYKTKKGNVNHAYFRDKTKSQAVSTIRRMVTAVEITEVNEVEGYRKDKEEQE